MYATYIKHIQNVSISIIKYVVHNYREIGGEIIVGEIKEKEKAKKQYVRAQQRGESAGYIGTK